MVNATENLGLFKYDPIADAKEKFNITQALNNNWDKIDEFSKMNNSGFGLFDTKLTDHVLEGQDAVGWALQGSLITMTYPDAVAKVKELYENGTETQYRGITCRRSTDGRYVADVAQKDAIDALFTESGVADFYILDVAGEQFYLPRSKWFNQMTLDTSLVNNFNEAGLPNIEGKVSNITFINNASTYSGALKSRHIASSSAGASNGPTGEISIDASLLNPLYGNSDTVQPPSSNKLLYYKVGNTVVNESQIDVGNVLSDLQLKADKDLSNTTPSQVFKDISMGWDVPDTTRAIDISSLSTYTFPCEGWLQLYILSPGGAEGYAYYNSDKYTGNYKKAYRISAYGDGKLSVTNFYRVEKGETVIKESLRADESFVLFIPCKGAEL